MDFHLLDDGRISVAAKELCGLGFGISENGIPVRFLERDDNCISLSYESGVLTIEAGRHQIFFALKAFSDAFSRGAAGRIS